MGSTETFDALGEYLNALMSHFSGMICWWPGPLNSYSSVFWVLCNGQAISRTTYANLFRIIGTKYGAGDGSTTFNVPDLITTAENTSGNFIRATATDSQVGVKTKDEIRRMRGSFATCSNDNATEAYWASGTFQKYYSKTVSAMSGSVYPWDGKQNGVLIGFDSNQDIDGDKVHLTNSMAGHGAGTDIHPYYISLIPLIHV